MPLAKRLIPCLDIDCGRVVKGINFVNLRDAGDPVEVAKRYDQQGADEITFLDITASVNQRPTLLSTVQAVAETLSIPLTVGGGVRCCADVERLLKSGADKVSINTAAVNNPQLLRECANIFGQQCIVLAIDAKKHEHGWKVNTHGGRCKTEIDAIAWAKKAEQLGAGEILLTSMDSDGAKDGYDLSLTRAVSLAVGVPVIASGGAGQLKDIADVLTTGLANAALAATLFHDQIYTVNQIKQYLKQCHIEIREL